MTAEHSDVFVQGLPIPHDEMLEDAIDFAHERNAWHPEEWTADYIRAIVKNDAPGTRQRDRSTRIDAHAGADVERPTQRRSLRNRTANRPPAWRATPMPDEQAVQSAQVIAFALAAAAATATCVLRHHGTLARNASNSACLALAVAGAASAIAGESPHATGQLDPVTGKRNGGNDRKVGLLGALWMASVAALLWLTRERASVLQVTAAIMLTLLWVAAATVAQQSDLMGANSAFGHCNLWAVALAGQCTPTTPYAAMATGVMAAVMVIGLLGTKAITTQLRASAVRQLVTVAALTAISAAALCAIAERANGPPASVTGHTLSQFAVWAIVGAVAIAGHGFYAQWRDTRRNH